MRAMHRIGSLIAIATATTGVLFTAASAATDSPERSSLFRDYFNSTSDADWAFFNRDGRFQEGRLWIDGDYLPGAIGRDGWALTHVGDLTWTDYALLVAWDSTNKGGSPAEHHMVTAYVRVAAETGNLRQTMYRIDVWDPNQVDEGSGCGDNLPYGVVGLTKYVEGASLPGETECLSNTVVGTNTMRVVARGATITVFINGERVLSYTDPTPITFGGVGVGEIWELNGWFDNVIVSGGGSITSS